MRGLRTLALRTSTRDQNGCASWLARRWHAVVAFGIARQLHALALSTLDQRQVEAVLPDWADGPPIGLALDHYAQVLGQPGFDPEED
eukprot:14327624-Alexandrium_andersonii.AAC.1